MKYNLDCYDGRRSFYGKATVRVCGDYKTLRSYDTDICEYNEDKNTLTIMFDPTYSMTTLRHFKSFLVDIGWSAAYEKITKKFVEKHFEVDNTYTYLDFYEMTC